MVGIPGTVGGGAPPPPPPPPLSIGAGEVIGPSVMMLGAVSALELGEGVGEEGAGAGEDGEGIGREGLPGVGDGEAREGVGNVDSGTGTCACARLTASAVIVDDGKEG